MFLIKLIRIYKNCYSMEIIFMINDRRIDKLRYSYVVKFYIIVGVSELCIDVDEVYGRRVGLNFKF